MKDIKLFELFSGIGAPRKALVNLGVEFESLGYSEIDSNAIKQYQELYNDFNNYGDICSIEKLPKGVNLVVHGSPCQDFSNAGLSKGGDINSGTRSSLMWETVRLVSYSLPEFVIWENVKGVLNKKNIHNFNKYLEEMELLGYTNSYEILNAKDFGIPQNRERIFVVSSLNFEFNFENLEKKQMKTLESIVDFEKIRENPPSHGSTYKKNIDTLISNKCNKGVYNIDQSESFFRFTSFEYCPTLRTKNIAKYNNGRWEFLNKNERLLLMGFDYNDFKMLNNFTLSQIVRTTGNSIVVDVVESIFKEIIKPKQKKFEQLNLFLWYNVTKGVL